MESSTSREQEVLECGIGSFYDTTLFETAAAVPGAWCSSARFTDSMGVIYSIHFKAMEFAFNRPLVWTDDSWPPSAPRSFLLGTAGVRKGMENCGSFF